jgi:valyl-tRNA synthetase
VPGGFIGDPDVMDTWATSSLTPHIAGDWEAADGNDLFDRVFPMDMRPQGTTSSAPGCSPPWCAATTSTAPRRGATRRISGWILDPDRKKMSKSKGNATVTPIDLLEQYGTDAVRYWAANGRPGVDTALDEGPDEGRPQAGQQAAQRVEVRARLRRAARRRAPTEAIDLAMLARLQLGVVAEATKAFEAFDYARALEVIEQFFWWFCDDYVELVKGRAYAMHGADGAASALAALREALHTIHRLFAPFIPYVTDEVWSWWQQGSVHTQPWPTQLPAGGDAAIIDPVCEVMSAVRRAKTEAKASQKTPVALLVVQAPAELHAAIASAEADLRDAGSIAEVRYEAADAIACQVTLAPTEDPLATSPTAE